MKKFLRIPFYLNNWWLFYLDYFGLITRRNQVYKLNNGVSLHSIAGQGDGLIINEIWGNNEYTPRDFEIKLDDNVVDIGGHRGYFTVFSSTKAKQGRVYAFEPIKKNYDILRKNLAANKCSNVTSFQLGISGTKGVKKLYISPSSSSGISLIKDWFKDDKRKITSSYTKFITLHDIFSLCHIKKIDFLKIDCEGAEYEILLNTSKKDLARINKISMEFHQIGKLKVSVLKKFLIKNNFMVDVINSNNTIGMLYAKKRKA